MKIGLIGAPGSGKTALADALSTELNMGVIDDYVEAVEFHLNYVMGRYATYVGNLAIMIERHACERGVGDDFISCGTPIDTVTYMAASAHLTGDEAWQRRALGSLTTAGCMVDDMWEYDHVFYLPGGTADANEDGYLKTIEEELRTSLRLFEIPHTTLTPEQTIEQKIDVIKTRIGSAE